MKYLFIATQSGIPYVSTLTKEIRRFDIRAEFKCFIVDKPNGNFHIDDVDFISRSAFNNCLANKSIESVISVDNTSNLSRLKKSKKPLVYYQVPENETSFRALAGLKKSYCKILLTIPEHPEDHQVNYVGCPISDDTRFNSVSDLDTENGMRIGVLSNKSISKATLVALKESFPEARFLFDTDNDSGDQLYDLLKKVNVVISFSRIDELKALFSNCPQVRYKKRSLLTFSRERDGSALNKLAEKEVIQVANSSKELILELKQLLYNHQYCAGVMQDYQHLKEKFGLEPAYRKAASVIVEFMEDKSES